MENQILTNSIDILGERYLQHFENNFEIDGKIGIQRERTFCIVRRRFESSGEQSSEKSRVAQRVK